MLKVIKKKFNTDANKLAIFGGPRFIKKKNLKISTPTMIKS